jgi:hypothetical protein
VDLWIARQRRLRRAHLLEMIAAVVETVLPGQPYRCNETIAELKRVRLGHGRWPRSPDHADQTDR